MIQSVFPYPGGCRSDRIGRRLRDRLEGMPVRWDSVLAGESLNDVSARLRVPACMLMRANGLFSAAWLLPGREIAVPEGACGGDFPCPREAFYRVAGQCRGAGRRMACALPEDTAASFAARHGLSEARLRALNRLDGCLYPGMELAVE